MAMEGKTVRKRHEKCQHPVQDESLKMEKNWVMMMHQNKKHEE